jgi:hypothetical protein
MAGVGKIFFLIALILRIQYIVFVKSSIEMSSGWIKNIYG